MKESDAVLKYCKALESCENMDHFRAFKSWYYKTRDFNLGAFSINAINGLLSDKIVVLMVKRLRNEKAKP